MKTRWEVFTRDDEHMMDIPIRVFVSEPLCREYAAHHTGPEYLQAKEQVRSGAIWLDTDTPVVSYPRWEVALLCGYGSKATQIVGPFFNVTDAMDAMDRMNRNMGSNINGRVWVWANWGEVPRGKECTIQRG